MLKIITRNIIFLINIPETGATPRDDNISSSSFLWSLSGCAVLAASSAYEYYNIIMWYRKLVKLINIK